MNTITGTELRQRISAGESLVIIDVREAWEYEEFNIGARNIPLHSIESRLDELQPHQASEIVVYCNSGSRGMTAQRILERAGFGHVRNLEAGINAW